MPPDKPNDSQKLTQVPRVDPVEKPPFSGMVEAGARSLGLPLRGDQIDALSWLSGELVRWNARVNLTAILDPIEIGDKHILDSLTVLRVLDSNGATLLDAGTGGGFPGLPLAIARPGLAVTLVDAVAKKVGFLKHVIAELGLAPRVRAVHQTLRGNAQAEGLGPFDTAVSRACMDPTRWAALARPYLRKGGMLVVMGGGDMAAPPLDGWQGPRVERVVLPLTGADRTLLAYRNG
jgi:16S rRNA (guanine527-N7)-methyltransferase